MTPQIKGNSEEPLPDEQDPNKLGHADGEKTVAGSTTNADSKTVMLAAERGDTIHITEVVSSNNMEELPEEVEVLRRSEPYYGPKLLTYACVNGTDQNFLLTAPGPRSQLKLWIGEKSANGKRKQWREAAEVKAALSAELPPYRRCAECGEKIRSIEHERAAISGQCARRETWD